MAKELKPNSNAKVSDKTKKELDKKAEIIEKESKKRDAKIKSQKFTGGAKTAIGVTQIIAGDPITKVVGIANVANGHARHKNAEKRVDKKTDKKLAKQEKKIEKSLNKDLAFKSKEDKAAIKADLGKEVEKSKAEHHLDSDAKVLNATSADVKEQSKTIKGNEKIDKQQIAPQKQIAEEKAIQAKHDDRVKQAENKLRLDDIERNRQAQQNGMEY